MGIGKELKYVVVLDCSIFFLIIMQRNLLLNFDDEVFLSINSVHFFPVLVMTLLSLKLLQLLC